MNLQPLTGKQTVSVREAEAWINLWEGSVRSSKTISSLIRWLKYVRQGPAGNLAMIGKTERTLKRNVIDLLVQELVGPGRCKVNWGEGEMSLFGRRVYLAGANNELAVSKIQGLTLAGSYVDELSLMPESMWKMLLSRHSVEGSKIFGTTNPDSPNHWVKKDWLDGARVWVRHDGSIVRNPEGEQDLARFSFRLTDNPTLPAGYVENLTSSFTGLWRARYIDGRWVLAEGTIYDSFLPEPGEGTVVRSLPSMRRWWLAIDYGTTNPFVAILIGEGEDGRLYAAREWRWDSKVKGRQLTDAQYSAELRKWLDELALSKTGTEYPFAGCAKPERILVDPSAASFIRQMHVDDWAHVRGADNAVADGIRSTATLLAGDRLKIHEQCAAGIDEMSGYVWDPKAQKLGEDAPLKQDDHFPDALRYGVMGTRSAWRHWTPNLELAAAA